MQDNYLCYSYTDYINTVTVVNKKVIAFAITFLSNIIKLDGTNLGTDETYYVHFLFREKRYCVVFAAVIFLQLQCPFRH